jgi:nucleoside-diphosphate-sugar epimerase
VVVGSTGIIGRAITAKLAEIGGWQVIGVTRPGGVVPGVDEAIAVGLSDAKEARRGLAPADSQARRSDLNGPPDSIGPGDGHSCPSNSDRNVRPTA